MRKRFALSVAAIAALSMVGAPAVFAQDDIEVGNPDHLAYSVIERGAEVGGRSYQDWINDYGEWFLWSRTPDNPPPDVLADCDGGQPGGDVFFIPSTQIGHTTEYECAVRSDQHLLLWIGGTVGWVDDGQTQEERLAQLYSGFTHNHGFEFTLDGRTLPVGGHLGFEPDFYSVELGEDNLFGLPAGPRDVFMVGYFALLEPLEAGEHSLTVKSSLLDPERGTVDTVATATLDVADASS